MTAGSGGARGGAFIAKVLIGFVVLWLVLDRTAAGLASFRGEAGLFVCVLVVVAAVVVERVLFATRPGAALAALGFGMPRTSGLGVGAAIAIILVAFLPACAAATGVPLDLRTGWIWLALGMFAQGGVAEETVFRGFLFQHFREGRSFWKAALLAGIPFTAVHLLLFVTLDFPLALASVVLAVFVSFPLARLFEFGGRSIWPPAIVHFAIQAPIKLVDVPVGAFGPMAIAWMVVSALAPWAVFAVRAGRSAKSAGS